MQRIALLLVFAACVYGALPSRTRAIHRAGLVTPHVDGVGDAAQWFTQQKLDHFDPTNNATFSQLYYINDTYYAKNGPVFFLLGGEGPLSQAYVSGHFVVNNWAQQFGALIVAAEHRFYGSSVPTADLSTANLQYLTVQQALADFAALQAYLSRELFLPANTQWISVGGSYSGALSAWFREFYPEIISAAYGTSGPVLAKLDYYQYLEAVTAVLEPKCVSAINQTTAAMMAMTNQQLQQKFNTCEPIQSDLDLINFFQNVYGEFIEIVQYNNDNTNYLPFGLSTACNYLTSASSPIDGLVNFINAVQPGQCLEISYTNMIAMLQNTSTQATNPMAADRTWTWQTCIEFGYYQTAEGNTIWPKNGNLAFYLQICNDTFGSSYVPNVDTIFGTNELLGGLHLNASNVVLPTGSADPWYPLGILQSHPTLNQKSVHMEGTAHCADLYMPLPTDPQSLVFGRKAVVQFLTDIITNNVS